DGVGVGVLEGEDGRCEERTLELVGTTDDDLATGGDELVDGAGDVGTLVLGDERAHGGGAVTRVAGDDLVVDAGCEGVGDGVDECGRDDGAADGGALLAGL